MLVGMWSLFLSLTLVFAESPDDDGAVLIRPGGAVVEVDEQPMWTLLDGESTAAPISLDLVQADLHHVLRLISDVGGINIVVADDVKGQVTVRLVDVPWDQALAVILQTHGLAAAPVGQVVLVTRY